MLKEDTPDRYRLLKVAEAANSNSKASGKQPTAAVDELPPVQTVQQQQAEQMRVFWKVRLACYVIEALIGLLTRFISSRAC